MAANYVGLDILPLDIGQPYAVAPLGTTFTALPSIVYPAQGLRVPNGTTTSIYRVFRIPTAATMTTGITTELLLCCDPAGGGNNADLRGTNSYWDVAVGIQTDGTSLGDDSEFTGGTLAPQTGPLTMPTAAGKLKKLNIVGTIANYTNAAGAIAAGVWCTLRIRRLGTNALDTNIGDVLVAGISCWVY